MTYVRKKYKSEFAFSNFCCRTRVVLVMQFKLKGSN